MHCKRHARGFTLIELLVVIAIIGILSSVVLASVNAVRVRAYDAKRASDMRAVVDAFEMYYADHGEYPDALAKDGCGGQRQGYCLNDSDLVAVMAPYLPVMPKDPVWADQYYDYLYFPDQIHHQVYLLARMQGTTWGDYCRPPQTTQYTALFLYDTYPPC